MRNGVQTILELAVEEDIRKRISQSCLLSILIIKLPLAKEEQKKVAIRGTEVEAVLLLDSPLKVDMVVVHQIKHTQHTVEEMAVQEVEL